MVVLQQEPLCLCPVLEPLEVVRTSGDKSVTAISLAQIALRQATYHNKRHYYRELSVRAHIICLADTLTRHPNREDCRLRVGLLAIRALSKPILDRKHN